MFYMFDVLYVWWCFMFNDVLYVWWCFIFDDVLYVWWCFICLMFYMFNDVLYVYWCFICLMMFYMFNDVLYVWWCFITTTLTKSLKAFSSWSSKPSSTSRTSDMVGVTDTSGAAGDRDTSNSWSGPGLDPVWTRGAAMTMRFYCRPICDRCRSIVFYICI